jgi:hypothetical protein
MQIFKKIYDCIVLGDNIGGLVLATILAKRGANVLVINDIKQKKFWNQDGYAFLGEPIFLAGVERGSFFEQIFKEICYDWVYDTDDVGTLYQVISKENRFDLICQNQAFNKELKREFPQQFNYLAESYSKFDKNSLRLTSFLKNLDFGPKLNIFSRFKLRYDFSKKYNLNNSNEFKTDPSNLINSQLTNQARILSYTENFNSNILSWLSSVNFKKYSHNFLNKFEFTDFFMKRFHKFKGDIDFIDQVEGFNQDGGSINCVYLKKKTKQFFCRYLVLNGNMKKYVNFFPKSLKKNRLMKVLAKLNVKYFWYTVNFVVKATVVPVGMKKNVVYLIDPYKDKLQENILAIAIGEIGKDNVEPDQVVIQASLPIGVDTTYTRESYFNLTKKIYAYLQELIPFFSEHLIYSYPYLVDSKAYSHDNFKEYIEFLITSDYNQIYTDDINTFLDLFGLDIYLPYKNVLLMGRTVLPSLGIVGELYSGLKLADYLTTKIKF